MKKLAPFALLLLLGFGLAAGGKPAATAFVPDPAAEAAACIKATTDKPTSWNGVDQGNVGQTEWLARVAFHIAYGRWPDANQQAELDRLAEIIACVSLKLLPPPPPVDFPPLQQPAPPQLPPISNVPTPGGYYAIKFGDTLFGVSSAAYGTQGQAKKINTAPYNARFLRPIDQLPGLSADEKLFEKGIFGQNRITFSPQFGTFAQQFADQIDGSQGDGNSYAVIYIPE